MTGRVHVVGAGVAGLACALDLVDAGRPVVLWEAAPHAGGRCRSWHDPALDRVVDNGPHLILGGNRAVRAHVRRVGGRLVPLPARFPVQDGAGATRTVEPGPRHVLAGGWHDLGPLWRLMRAGPESTVADCAGPDALARLWGPLCLAVLNTPPAEASARLLGRAAATLLLGGRAAARPWVAPEGLDAALITPAVTHLKKAGAGLFFGERITGLGTDDGHLTALYRRRGAPVALAPGEPVVLAVPRHAAGALWPGVPAGGARPIVSAHFRAPDTAARLPPLLGLEGSTAQWVFRQGDVVSVVVSAADALTPTAPASLAARLWQDVAAAAGTADTSVPPWRVVKERRATPDQTPPFAATRPGPRTACSNLFLAGDWTATGLPATLEGAIRSGRRAARLARRHGS